MSIFLPSFLIVIGVNPYFDRLRNSAYFYGVISAVLCFFVGLLLTVTFRFALNIPWDIPRVLLAAAAFVTLLAYSAEIATDSEANRHALRRKSAVREVGAERLWDFVHSLRAVWVASHVIISWFF